MFQILGEFVYRDEFVVYKKTRYIAKVEFRIIDKMSFDQYVGFVKKSSGKQKENYPTELHDHLKVICLGKITCQCSNENDGQYYKCNCDFSEYFPVYIGYTEKDAYLIHPDEREHVDRFLAGTDNPIYDLVHELRYNPLFGLDKDIRKAKEEDKKRKLSF